MVVVDEVRVNVACNELMVFGKGLEEVYIGA